MYHGLYIYSCIEGHFGCFQFLVIMNKAAVIFVCSYLCGHMFSTHLGKCLGVSLVDQMGKIKFSFVGNCESFPGWL